MDTTLAYDEYEEFGGVANEETFDALYPQARDYVAHLIGHKQPNQAQVKRVKMAIAICVQKFAEYGVENIAGGFSLGSFSMSAGSNGVIGGREYAKDAVVVALSPTGLLYAGVC